MRARAFWKAVTVDRSEFLTRFLSLLRREGIRFCVIGGQGVNAYAAPLVSLDLDIVVVADDMSRLLPLLEHEFRVTRFPHSVNVAAGGSDLRAQIQLDPRYAPFVQRAMHRDVLGEPLPVAAIEDVLQGKIWAVEDVERRGSTRQKDLTDIARLLEVEPTLRNRVPQAILDLLL